MIQSNLTNLLVFLLKEGGHPIAHVWHISPDANLNFKRKGQGSPKFGMRGMFVSDYESIADTWAAWVNFGKERQRDKGCAKFNPRDTNQAYRTLYLYKIAIPKDILEKVKDLYNIKADEFSAKNSDADTMGAFGWAPELFIPEEYFPLLKIAGKQKRTWYDFENEKWRRAVASFTGQRSRLNREKKKVNK